MFLNVKCDQTAGILGGGEEAGLLRHWWWKHKLTQLRGAQPGRMSKWKEPKRPSIKQLNKLRLYTKVLFTLKKAEMPLSSK